MKKFVSFFMMMIVAVVMTGVWTPLIAEAASVSSAKAVFGRLKASTNSDSIVIQFVSPTGIQAGTSDDITLTFSADFTLAAEAAANFDIGLGDSGTCSSAIYSDEGVHLTAPDASNWQVDVTGQVITLDPDTDSALTAGRCVRIEIGTAATTGGTGAANTVANGAADDDDTITIGGGFSDTGTITVDIIDDDQVSVTATVNQTMSFDIDAAVTDQETSTPYSVPLGVLSSGSVTVSNGSSINMVILEGGTNASGGMNVTVKNANGNQGLKSTSTPADYIPSATATMSAGTSNYGLCVATANLSGFTRSGTYTTTCASNSQTNGVVVLSSTTPTDMVGTTAPVSNAHAEIMVNATIAGATPAHDDYADTLTFIATASY